MKKLILTDFFRTLQEASQTGIDKNADRLQNEYDDFANTIFSVGANCHDCIQNTKTDNRVVCHNMLVYTRVELSGLKKFSIKKSSISFSYLEKAIELVDKQADYITDFVDCPLKHKNIKIKWLGTLLEYVEWIYGLYEYLNQKGEKITIKTLFTIFNPIFGFKDFQYSSYFNVIKARMKEHSSIFEIQEQLLTQRKEKSFE